MLQSENKQLQTTCLALTQVQATGTNVAANRSLNFYRYVPPMHIGCVRVSKPVPHMCWQLW
jgi:hypothetical protein